MTDSDGFTRVITENNTEQVTKNYCKDNIMWIVNTAAAGLERSRGKLESADTFVADAESLKHNHWDCKLLHWNTKENGALCGACIGAFPCTNTPCHYIHPSNYPSIQREIQVHPHTHAHSHAPAQSGRPNQYQGRQNQGFVPKTKVLMCKSALADEFGIDHPSTEKRCTGVDAKGRPCNFAHNILDQTSTLAQREFISRYENGTLNVQKIMDEIIKVMTSCTPSEQQVIFKANETSCFPSYDRAFAKDWLMMWSKAASNARKTKPLQIASHNQIEKTLIAKRTQFDEENNETLRGEIINLNSTLLNIEDSFKNTNILTLFDGGMEEEIVWEMTRLFKICFSSYPMEEVKLGGKNNLCFPGPRDEENTTDNRYRLQTSINELIAKRDLVKKDKTLKAKLSELNEEINVASRHLDIMNQIPICQGGTWCKFGVHVSNINSTGTLFVIDSDNFNGRSNANIPDVLEKRVALKKTMNSLSSERTYKQSLLEENSSGLNRHELQSRINEIGTLLTELRNEYMNMFNRILLFPDGSVPLVIKPYVNETKSTEAIILDMASFCNLPPSSNIDQSMRDFYMKIHIFREKIAKKRTKNANAIMIRAIQNFLSVRENKFRAIANASESDAIKLYRDLIKNNHFITIIENLSSQKKKNSVTFDGRRVFYLSEDDKDKNIYESNGYGVLRPCASGTGLTTPTLDDLVSKFDHNKFKTYFGSGAFTVMSFNAFNTVKFMREAWSYFAQSSDSWSLFIEKVLSSNNEFESMGIIREKIPRNISESSYDDLPYTIVERRVYCPEREKYGDDSWAFFFKIPLAKNPKIVGEDSKLAMEQPDLFNEFMNANTVITFTAWLLSDGIELRRKQIRAAYIAYKSDEFANYNWNTIFTYVNFVRICDSKITIQYFSENEFFTKKWISSPASKKGITLESFLANPIAYIEYYQHDFSSFGTIHVYTFEQFMKDKIDGWTLVRPKKMTCNKITSLAWISGDLFDLVAKNSNKNQLWSIKDLIEYGTEPNQFLNFSKGGNQFIVPRSICDDIFFQIVRAIKSSNVSELKMLLEQLPSSLSEANMRLDTMISEYRVEMACKKQTAFHNFFDLVSNKFSKEEISELNDDVVSRIEEFIKLSNKRNRTPLTKAFTQLMQISSIDIDASVLKIKRNLTTDVCPTFTDFGDSTSELKTPTLITIARNMIDELGSIDNQKPIMQKVSVNSSSQGSDDDSDEDSDDEIIIGGSNINFSKKNVIDCDFENFQPNQDMFANPKTTPLQDAARFNLTGNKQYYINRVNITKERGTKITQSYWAIGPFQSNVDAKSTKSAISNKLKTSGITINKFSKEDHQDTFEILIPDKGIKMAKRADRRGASNDTSSAMEQGVLDEISDLVPVILKSLNVVQSAIYAPNIMVDEVDESNGFTF